MGKSISKNGSANSWFHNTRQTIPGFCYPGGRLQRGVAGCFLGKLQLIRLFRELFFFYSTRRYRIHYLITSPEKRRDEATSILLISRCLNWYFFLPAFFNKKISFVLPEWHQRKYGNAAPGYALRESDAASGPINRGFKDAYTYASYFPSYLYVDWWQSNLHTFVLTIVRLSIRVSNIARGCVFFLI